MLLFYFALAKINYNETGDSLKMPKNPQQHSWTESNIIDDVSFHEQDAQDFKKLLGVKETAITPETPQHTPGTILVGRIVEITKDHVVVDVGLKSEGLVPIEEFSDPSQVLLDDEVEVLLDQAEDDNGQIVLSREKAERLRQWEHILSHCEEGSIVKGRVTTQSQRRPHGRHWDGSIPTRFTDR